MEESIRGWESLGWVQEGKVLVSFYLWINLNLQILEATSAYPDKTACLSQFEKKKGGHDIDQSSLMFFARFCQQTFRPEVIFVRYWPSQRENYQYKSRALL